MLPTDDELADAFTRAAALAEEDDGARIWPAFGAAADAVLVRCVAREDAMRAARAVRAGAALARHGLRLPPAEMVRAVGSEDLARQVLADAYAAGVPPPVAAAAISDCFDDALASLAYADHSLLTGDADTAAALLRDLALKSYAPAARSAGRTGRALLEHHADDVTAAPLDAICELLSFALTNAGVNEIAELLALWQRAARALKDVDAYEDDEGEEDGEGEDDLEGVAAAEVAEAATEAGVSGAVANGVLALEAELAREVLSAAALAEGGTEEALREAAAAHRVRAALERAGTSAAHAAAALAGLEAPEGNTTGGDEKAARTEDAVAAELEAEAAEVARARTEATAAKAARVKAEAEAAAAREKAEAEAAAVRAKAEREAAAAAASKAARERLAGASGAVAAAARLAAAAESIDTAAVEAATALAGGTTLPLVMEARTASALALAALLPLGLGQLIIAGDMAAARAAALAHARVHGEFRTGASAGDHALFGLLKPWADAGDGRLLLPGENPAGEVAAEAWAQAPSRAAQALERLEQ